MNRKRFTLGQANPQPRATGKGAAQSLDARTKNPLPRLPLQKYLLQLPRHHPPRSRNRSLARRRHSSRLRINRRNRNPKFRYSNHRDKLPACNYL
jgi:hypothetical protein